MPDETKVETTPEVVAPPAESTLDELKAELARARDALKAVNAEAAERRKKLSAYEADEAKRQEAEKKRRDAELSETEKLKNQIAEKDTTLQALQNDLKTWRIRQAIEREATVLNFQNPEDAYLLADMTGVEISEDGKVTGAKEAIEKLAKARTYLLKTEKPIPPGLNARNGNQTQDGEARQKELAQRFRIKI